MLEEAFASGGDGRHGHRTAVKGIWRVNGETDGQRFAAQQPISLEHSVQRYRQLIDERPWEAQNGTAREQAIAALQSSVANLNTSVQRLRSYSQSDLRHPTIEDMNGTTTHLFHGARPEAIRSILCNGLRQGRPQLYGAGVYLSDTVEKFGRFEDGDCDWSTAGGCKYEIDAMRVSNRRGGGFPKKHLLQLNRSKSVYYGLVVLTSPFRVARSYPMRRGGFPTRRNEKQLVWNPGKKHWESLRYNSTYGCLQTAEGRPLREKYQFQQGLSSKKHPDVLAKFSGLTKRGWHPILKHHDDYVVFQPEHTRVEYIVAYQRE